jgi:hypothetical protein
MKGPLISKEVPGGFVPLPLLELEGLPISERVVDRLIDILLAADELLGELQTEEANPLLWIEPHVQRVYREVDSLVRRFAD